MRRQALRGRHDLQPVWSADHGAAGSVFPQAFST